MPEYIDKEKLIRDLIDNRSFYPAIVKKAIEDAPTEDVVPRSEVEKIFEEIENTIKNEIKNLSKVLPQYEISNVLWNRVSGKINAFQDICDVISYLRKKYIGE